MGFAAKSGIGWIDGWMEWTPLKDCCDYQNTYGAYNDDDHQCERRGLLGTSDSTQQRGGGEYQSTGGSGEGDDDGDGKDDDDDDDIGDDCDIKDDIDGDSMWMSEE